MSFFDANPSAVAIAYCLRMVDACEEVPSKGLHRRFEALSSPIMSKGRFIGGIEPMAVVYVDAG